MDETLDERKARIRATRTERQRAELAGMVGGRDCATPALLGTCIGFILVGLIGLAVLFL